MQTKNKKYDQAVYAAVVSCDRCSYDKLLWPHDGIPLQHVAFVAANWLHHDVACRHDHAGNPVHRDPFWLYKEIKCIQCRVGTINQNMFSFFIKLNFMPRSHVSVHCALCDQCARTYGRTLCSRTLMNVFQCNRVVEKWVLLCLLYHGSGDNNQKASQATVCINDMDCVRTITRYVMAMLRQGHSCCTLLSQQ
jgi:hypothetical protein